MTRSQNAADWHLAARNAASTCRVV